MHVSVCVFVCVRTYVPLTLYWHLRHHLTECSPLPSDHSALPSTELSIHPSQVNKEEEEGEERWRGEGGSGRERKVEKGRGRQRNEESERGKEKCE